ncbi:MAG TPA: response regulator, partial [Gammaproteobacteria bacterium]
IEVGELDVCQEAFSPQDLISDIYSLMKIRVEEKNLRLAIEFDDSVPKTVISDKTRLRQILVNLVSNAIKFTNKGEIKLKTRVIHDLFPVIEFTITDTGIGMNARTMNRIFDPFVRGDNAFAPGAGLGLAITRRLVELLKGEIEVKSEEGRGTTFKVAVPIGLTGCNLGSSVEETVWKQRYANAALKPKQDGFVYRILVVDDHNDIRKMIQYLLRDAGAETDGVESGEKALEVIRQAELENRPYDVIILDIHLSGISGYAVASKLRQLNYRGAIIAVTAAAMRYEEEKCLAAGCDYYITKPIDEENLIGLIGRACSAKDFRKEAKPEAAKKNAQVLIVEDHRDSAESIARLLRIKGYSVETAYSGKAALEKCVTIRPEIILLDLTLPDMDGSEVLTGIRRELPDAFVAVLSGRSRSELVRQVHEEAFNAYFEKPPDLALLSETLADFTRSQGGG